MVCVLNCCLTIISTSLFKLQKCPWGTSQSWLLTVQFSRGALKHPMESNNTVRGVECTYNEAHAFSEVLHLEELRLNSIKWMNELPCHESMPWHCQSQLSLLSNSVRSPSPSPLLYPLLNQQLYDPVDSCYCQPSLFCCLQNKKEHLIFALIPLELVVGTVVCLLTYHQSHWDHQEHQHQTHHCPRY